MTEFEIQDTTKTNSRGAWCYKCGVKIEPKVGCHRVKYGAEIYHLSCFYKWINYHLQKISVKGTYLKGCYRKLKKHMPQILAESITTNDIRNQKDGPV